MNNLIRKNKELEIGGIAFGLTSGVITTLGFIVGMESATGSRLAVIAGILTISLSDALSDALGMHLSEESRLDEKSASIWMISLYTFLAKLLFSLVFLIPVLSLDLASAVRFSVVFGVLLIMILASIVAYRRKESWLKQSIGNGLLAIVVVITSYFLGHIAARIK